MTLDHAILAAILDEPDNDTHRLIAADWLDENGEPERAEFIRVSIELNRRRPDYFAGDDILGIPSADSERLLARQSKLLSWAMVGDRQPFDAWPLGWVKFRRGFLHTIRCSAAEWQRQTPPSLLVTYQAIGQQILRQHPVKRVEFTDCDSVLQIDKLNDCWRNALTRRSEHWYGQASCPTRDQLIDVMPWQLRAWGVGESVWSQIHYRPYRYEEVTTNV